MVSDTQVLTDVWHWHQILTSHDYRLLKVVLMQLQAVMAAAKQQHQQHMADIESHLQEATEATQHAQASEAEVKLTADSLRAAAKADQATATAAAQWIEAALQRLKDTLAAAAQDRAATTQQHADKLRGFILSTVHSAVCEATAGYRDVSELARDASGVLEGVCVEVRATVHKASQTLDRRLRGVESAIACGSQKERPSAGSGQLGHNQVIVRPSFSHPVLACNSCCCGLATSHLDDTVLLWCIAVSEWKHSLAAQFCICEPCCSRSYWWLFL